MIECEDRYGEKRILKRIHPSKNYYLHVLNHEMMNFSHIVRYYGSWIEDKRDLDGTSFHWDRYWCERFVTVELESCAGSLKEYLDARN